MDDFGNDYQTEEWAMTCTQYGYSMATFGFFDEVAVTICFDYCIDYAAQDI